jgi:hypothetical protein
MVNARRRRERTAVQGAATSCATRSPRCRPACRCSSATPRATRVSRYRIADGQARIFLVTQDQGLFVVPRP